ncbi:hypothetical protein ACWGJ2_22115 [Streptomyces sp. NPDC054796]|uniref:Uncharacterized protein n=1 Tax=Streptomyces daliensis TaxID=299421 RepID=A0A8T4IHK9_9ACTN|nr:hypothetical protein [Streptomyces daliensis]
MSDLLDALENQAFLTDALEEHFGRPRGWPLRIRAACAQLRSLHHLMGEADYAAFLDCVVRALDHQREPFAEFPSRPYSTCLAQALKERYGERVPETAEVAWHTVLGLCSLLGDEDFDRVMLAAACAKAGGEAREHALS